MLLSKIGLFFNENYRRPDIIWLKKEQALSLDTPEYYNIPQFIIELISDNELHIKLKKKMIDYKNAGVKVVWHIFPKLQQVDVYSGIDLTEMKVCTGETLCSASPALPGFEITAEAIFRTTPPSEI